MTDLSIELVNVMESKRDLLKVCNDHAVPPEDFRQQFCIRCIQPECTRSQAGTSLFEKRIVTWKERLFTNPPRMTEEDPRYKIIRGKQFLSLDMKDVPEIGGRSSWVDPRDLDSEPHSSKIIEVEATVEPVETLVVPTTPDIPLEHTVASKLMNTLVKKNVMVGGKVLPQPTVVPVSDPWAGKTVAKPGEKVVKPGSKIRFGA